MNKRLVVGGVAIGLAVVIAAGGLYASNMGFKLNYPRNGAGVGGSKSGRNTLSLPFNPQVGISKASETVKKIEGAWVKDTKVVVRDSRVTEWRVTLAVTFVVD